MPFKISSFRAHFQKHGDFAPSSKFDVRITAPPGLAIAAGDLRFQCETTELPGYNVNTVDNRYYGVGDPVASFPAAFADLTLNFICAGDFWEKKLFDRWMNLVIPFNNYNPNYKDAYTAPKIEINQYSGISRETAPAGETRDPNRPENQGLSDLASSEIGEKIYTVAFFHAFPTAIAPMNLNWGDDAFHRLAVTFRYEYWTTSDIELSERQRASGVAVTPPPAVVGFDRAGASGFNNPNSSEGMRQRGQLKGGDIFPRF